MRTCFHRLGVVAINLIVIIGLFAVIEAYFRLSSSRSPAEMVATNGLWQNYAPYVMFTSAPGTYPAWTNEFTGKLLPAHIVTNSLGFNDPREFDYTRPYHKADGERVVLFTGGSVAWGVGSTATDRTIAGRMQHHLNNGQNRIKYTVINMGMGSYIAYQQYLALQLWGESFDPDWVVSMDGFNDAVVGCAYSQGVGNPMYFATTRAYVLGYLFTKLRPVFYRGWAENELIGHSAAYRALTGKTYVPNVAVYDAPTTDAAPGRAVILPTKTAESREILAFYLKAEKAISALFPKARYILSTQPSVNSFSGDFVNIYDSPLNSSAHRDAMAARDKDLEVYLSHYQNEPCSKVNMQPTFTYTFVKGAILLERLVEELRGNGREISYHNTGTLFPDARADRIPYFIDPAHVSDKGADVLGQFYAQRVLEVDAGLQRPR